MPLHQKIKFQKIKILNYGLEVKTGKFKFGKKSSITPNSLTISYALSIANSGKSKRIFLSGLDGYETGDLRGREMEETLSYYKSIRKKADLISITPSQYKINTTAIYAL